MIKAIFYKEWIKMRCFYPLSALFLFGATAYALLRVQRVITFKGAAHVWEVMLEKEVVFIDILQYLPALLGVLLAVVQFVPEMAQKRLKLTLHLPFPQWKMILLMSGIGLGALALLFIVQTAVLWGYFHALLAPELVARILLTALPWYLAGLTLYLLTAWICLEPTWKRRLANLLIAVGVCRIFFLSDTPQAYDGMRELLWRHKEQGGVLCVVSHSYTQNILRDYRENGLPEPDMVFGWESPTSERKPSPYPLEQIMKRFGFSRSELLMLDDLKPGYDMAKSCSVDFAAAGWSNDIPEIESFMRSNCDKYFKTVAGFSDFLEEI